MSNTLTTSVRYFFGDGQYTFKLTAPLINELERKTGCGIGGLCKRVFNSEFKLLEISEVIRLGLIGGGTDPETAHAMVQTYLNNDEPIGAGYPLAVEILNAIMFGKEKEVTNA